MHDVNRNVLGHDSSHLSVGLKIHFQHNQLHCLSENLYGEKPVHVTECGH